MNIYIFGIGGLDRLGAACPGVIVSELVLPLKIRHGKQPKQRQQTPSPAALCCSARTMCCCCAYRARLETPISADAKSVLTTWLNFEPVDWDGGPHIW